MFGDTSENYRETRDNSCVIILKSRLNPGGHSARTRLVRDIFIDWRQPMRSRVLNDSARLLYYTRMKFKKSTLNLRLAKKLQNTDEDIELKTWVLAIVLSV